MSGGKLPPGSSLKGLLQDPKRCPTFRGRNWSVILVSLYKGPIPGFGTPGQRFPRVFLQSLANLFTPLPMDIC